MHTFFRNIHSSFILPLRYRKKMTKCEEFAREKKKRKAGSVGDVGHSAA